MPVDLESITDGVKSYVLQCRTRPQTIDVGSITVPSDNTANDVIFDAHRYVYTGLVEDINGIVYFRRQRPCHPRAGSRQRTKAHRLVISMQSGPPGAVKFVVLLTMRFCARRDDFTPRRRV